MMDPQSIGSRGGQCRTGTNANSTQVRPTDGVSSVHVRSLMEARNRRRSFFNSEFFGEPAWDMLLELFALHLEQRRRSISEVYRASGLPSTTALRWITKLEKEGLIIRKPDRLHANRVYVELSAKGEAAMRRFFEAQPPGVAII